MSFCGNCGNSLDDGAAFCPKCGIPTSQDRAQPASATQPDQNPQPPQGQPAPGCTPQGQPAQGQPGQGYTAQSQQSYYQPPQGQPMPGYEAPYSAGVDNTQNLTVDMGRDFTHTFEADDISKNKVFAIEVYLVSLISPMGVLFPIGLLGVIIALLAAQKSPFAMFHVRESMKLLVADVLLLVIAVLLFWTIIVPIAAAICSIILFVVKIICFVRAAKGQAKLAPIVGGMKLFR